MNYTFLIGEHHVVDGWHRNYYTVNTFEQLVQVIDSVRKDYDRNVDNFHSMPICLLGQDTYEQLVLPNMTLDMVMGLSSFSLPVRIFKKNITAPTNHYPHKCLKCGKPSYIGFSKVECSNPGCV